MATVELTNIDEGLYEALLMRAAKDNCSISQEVVAIVQKCLAQPPQDARKANEAFMELAGSWQESRTAEEIVADIRSSRQSGHRFDVDPHVFD
jgi:plasmid stability protein